MVEDVYAKKVGVLKPDHYKAETVEEKYSEYKKGYQERLARQEDFPDIILVLNETFYDLHQIAEFQTDWDYLAYINSREDIKREIPIIAAWGRYYDKKQQCYGIGEGEYSQVIEDYLCVEYNNIMGGRDRVSDFFNPVSQRD